MDLQGEPFRAYAAARERWAAGDCGRSPGPIQVRPGLEGWGRGGGGETQLLWWQGVWPDRRVHKLARWTYAHARPARRRPHPLLPHAPTASPAPLPTPPQFHGSNLCADCASISLALEQNSGVPIVLHTGAGTEE